jgi:4-diphosphocytidyl-2-C-methyl-D-erythritol kinase
MVIFRARSSAKINLSLDILERLPSGYHTLRSLVHPVGLWDEIELGFHSNGQRHFICSDPALQSDDNLCMRAFQAWCEAADKPYGASIRLRKNIPHGAGLGGGSGNAAAVLRLVNSHVAEPLPEERLLGIAAKLGADVPLFLKGNPVLMEGIGEQLSEVAPLEGWVLLLKPCEGFATPTIYRAWDEAQLQSARATDALAGVWKSGSLSEVAARMGNDLERAARLVSPLPERCVQLLRDAGSLGAMMSGSGSACFGLFLNQSEASKAQQSLEEAMAKDVLLKGATTFLAPLERRGVELL